MKCKHFIEFGIKINETGKSIPGLVFLDKEGIEIPMPFYWGARGWETFGKSGGQTQGLPLGSVFKPSTRPNGGYFSAQLR